MSIRAHRIKKIVYAKGDFFNSDSTLEEAIRGHSTTLTQINDSGGGIIETTLGALKEILTDAVDYELSPDEVRDLTEEIETLEFEGKDNDDYIQYDMF